MRGNADLSTLKPQPGQYDSYNPKYHPLPGEWAKQQLEGKMKPQEQSNHTNAPQTEIKRALEAERSQHEYWNKWQGVTPGKPVYEDPRGFSDAMVPRAMFGTSGS